MLEYVRAALGRVNHIFSVTESGSPFQSLVFSRAIVYFAKKQQTVEIADMSTLIWQLSDHNFLSNFFKNSPLNKLWHIFLPICGSLGAKGMPFWSFQWYYLDQSELVFRLLSQRKHMSDGMLNHNCLLARHHCLLTK